MLDPTATAKLEALLLAAGAGLRLAPAGNPVTPKFTTPLKPFTGFTVMVYGGVVAPWGADLVGETDRL